MWSLNIRYKVLGCIIAIVQAFSTATRYGVSFHARASGMTAVHSHDYDQTSLLVLSSSSSSRNRRTSRKCFLIRGGDSPESHDENNDDDDQYHCDNDFGDNSGDMNTQQESFTYYNIRFDPATQHFKAVIRPQTTPPTNPNPPPTFEHLQDLLEDKASSSHRRSHATTDSRFEQNNNNKMMLDLLLDQVIGTEPGIVTDRFVPSRLWMWDQWTTKILIRYSLRNVIRSTLYSTTVCMLIRWLLISIPSSTATTGTYGDVMVERQVIERALSVGNKIWKTFGRLTTVLLVVFLAQASIFWTSIYHTSRIAQARMNDILLLLSTHASRRYKYHRYHQEQANQPSRPQKSFRSTRIWPGAAVNRQAPQNSNSYYFTYTSDAEVFLNDMEHKMRLMQLLWWAATARRYRILLTDTGINRMVAKGVITPDEKQILDIQQLVLPRTQYYTIILEWMMWKFQQALTSKTTNKGRFRHRKQMSPLLHGDVGFEQVMLDKFCALRSYHSLIREKMEARMPMTYALYVQIVVDLFLICAPAFQYLELGILGSIISTVLLNIFCGGLLDLAFALLDPFDNEGDFYHRRTGQVSPVYLDLSVLIRESNAASHRSIMAASNLDW
jgi:Bestrophin, RFP-TM, chloride channel